MSDHLSLSNIPVKYSRLALSLFSFQKGKKDILNLVLHFIAILFYLKNDSHFFTFNMAEETSKNYICILKIV